MRDLESEEINIVSAGGELNNPCFYALGGVVTLGGVAVTCCMSMFAVGSMYMAISSMYMMKVLYETLYIPLNVLKIIIDSSTERVHRTDNECSECN